jgi:hypothetical protein
VKAPAVRKLAERHSLAELEAAAEALSEEQPAAIEVEGEDDGERLTHLLLAARIRRRMDEGLPLKEAFREQMGQVRALLDNEA